MHTVSGKETVDHGLSSAVGTQDKTAVVLNPN